MYPAAKFDKTDTEAEPHIIKKLARPGVQLKTS